MKANIKFIRDVGALNKSPAVVAKANSITNGPWNRGIKTFFFEFSLKKDFRMGSVPIRNMKGQVSLYQVGALPRPKPQSLIWLMGLRT